MVVQWASMCALGVVSGLACYTRHVYLSHYSPYYYVHTGLAPRLCVNVYADVLVSIVIEHAYTLPYRLSHPIS